MAGHSEYASLLRSVSCVVMLVLVSTAHCVPFNFVNRYRPFITGISVFDEYRYETLIGSSILLATIWLGQHGYLPLRDTRLADHIEHLQHVERTAQQAATKHDDDVAVLAKRRLFSPSVSKRRMQLSRWDRLLLKIVSWFEKFSSRK